MLKIDKITHKISKSNPFLRILLILIIAAGIWRLAFYTGVFVFGSTYTDYSVARHVFHAVFVCIFMLPVIFFFRKVIDNTTLSGLGLGEIEKAWKPFLIGALILLTPASIGIALCLLFGWTQIQITAQISEIIIFIPLLIALVFIYEALPEELLFRGYIFTNLTEKFSQNIAALIQAGLFVGWGMLIGAAASIDRIILFFVFAWILAVLRYISGSIWVPIGFHVAFQTVAQLLLNETRGFFILDNAMTLQIISFGILPFALAEIIARSIYKNK